jgi:hypothetical protein
MKLKHTRAFLEKLQVLDIPISNTTRGETIQQTYRNKLTAQLKEALFKDCQASFEGEDGMSIIPFLTKDGVILDVPNSSIADNADPNFCNGSISIEWSFTIKGLEFDGAEAAREYEFSLEQAKKKAEEAEAKKQAKIERDKAARAERERKRAKAIEAAMLVDED